VSVSEETIGAFFKERRDCLQVVVRCAQVRMPEISGQILYGRVDVQSVTVRTQQVIAGEGMPNMPSSAYQALCRVPDYAESMI